MLVRDIMTKDVITVTPDTHLIEVKRLVEENKLKRIPVVDSKGRLLGVVTDGMVTSISSQYAGAKNWYDYAYNVGAMFRTPVKEVMNKAVVTVKPNATVEEALALAQMKRVGSLIVVDDNSKVVGIVTTNDFFYRIVNPVLGIGLPGYRLWVEDGGEGKALEEIISTINKLCAKIVTLHIIVPPDHEKKDLVIHVDCEKPEELIEALRKKGYEADIRRR
jgi:acetoin utilization protein AcuB